MENKSNRFIYYLKILSPLIAAVIILSIWFFRLKKFWPTDNFLIEIIGSGGLAYALFFITKLVDKEQNKIKQSNKLKVIKHRLQIVFNRTTEMVNTSTETGENKKLYFDNSYINHLYHTVNENLEELFEYSEYYQDNTLVNNLISYASEVENGYIAAEKLDVLLIKMAKKVNISDKQMRRELIYYKATTIAGFNKQLIAERLNEPFHISEHFADNQATFIERYYKKANDKSISNLYSESNKLERALIKKRNELLIKVEEIKNSLQRN